MNASTDQLILKLQAKLKELELQKNVSQKPILYCQASKLMQELEKIVKEMPMSYQKERLEKQLELVRHKLSRLEREMMEEVRFLRDTSTKLGIDLEQNGYQYNPRMTMQQNMLRTVIWQEVTEGQMLLKQEELEDIARRMEKNKEVVDEIDMLVRQQGQKLDIIESRIMVANKNVKEANEHMDKANVLYGGKPRPKEQKQLPPPNRQSMNEQEINAARKTLTPEQAKIVSSLRLKVRGFFGQLGYNIGKFFTNIFTWGKKPSS